jgi:2-keto-4-pentenoate hydratase/2-oxohepta-3-ene-1,7-dioic acid hydratase in catechol pathway
VIGSRVRGVSKENALEAVRGYLCLNDVSARDLQFADKQWSRGKSPDTFCPVGPELVPAADVPDPQSLSIRAILNGRVMQDSSTSNMVFGVADLIAFITQAITLEPGDLIATGTPAGVGAFRDPPVFMRPGDEITIEIEGLGALTNPVVAA